MDRVSSQASTVFLADTPATVLDLLMKARKVDDMKLSPLEKTIHFSVIKTELLIALRQPCRHFFMCGLYRFDREERKPLSVFLKEREESFVVMRRFFAGWNKGESLQVRVMELTELVTRIQMALPRATVSSSLFTMAVSNPWYVCAAEQINKRYVVSPSVLETFAMMLPSDLQRVFRLDYIHQNQIYRKLVSEENAFVKADVMLSGALKDLKMDYELFGAVIPACTISHQGTGAKHLLRIIYGGQVFRPKDPKGGVWTAALSMLLKEGTYVDTEEPSVSADSYDDSITVSGDGGTLLVSGTIRYRNNIGFRVTSQENATVLARHLEDFGWTWVRDSHDVSHHGYKLYGERIIEIFWDTAVHTGSLLYFDSNSRFIQKNGVRSVELTAETAFTLVSKRFSGPKPGMDNADQIFDAAQAGFRLDRGRWMGSPEMKLVKYARDPNVQTHPLFSGAPWMDIWNVEVQRMCVLPDMSTIPDTESDSEEEEEEEDE